MLYIYITFIYYYLDIIGIVIIIFDLDLES